MTEKHEEILRAEELTKTFRVSRKQQKILGTNQKRITAADHLSFSAYRGEIFGLLGPNGAGKTTTLRMIATLISPDKGDVTVDGASVVKTPWEVRAKIGFLTSELKLEEFFTPDYMFDFFSALHRVPDDVRDRRKKILFERFGIDRYAQVKIGNLSTGMKQKLSIVISIVHDPEIIIFDEPTNGLDIITARSVSDFLLEQKAKGKSIIVSTHIFSLAERICDRVGVIVSGRMVACGTLAELCGGKSLEDRFFEIYERETGGLSDAK